MPHAKTAESRGKTAQSNTHSGTMEGQQKTAPVGGGTPARSLTTTSVLRGHVMAATHSIHVEHRPHQTAERNAG